MKYLSVCSGIEAATVAWHGFGWTPVAFAEVEAFPSAVLAHHYPTVPNLGDLTRYREWPEGLLAEVDLLVGGTPCQAFSVAGKRQSLDDERGNLSLTYVNLFHHINEVRNRHGRSPAIALWENVPGCLSTKDNAFGCILGGLLGCDEAPQTESGKWDKAGFLCGEAVRVGYRVLDAQYFGVAQRRRRVFLVAVPCELVERFGERACPSEILSLRESVLGNPPTRGASWEGAARAAQGGPASGGGCGEPFYLDRASFNQGENALHEPQITSDGGGRSTCLRRAVGRRAYGGGLTARTPTTAESCPSVANSLTARMHKGFNTTVDEGQTPIVTHGGVFDGAVAFKPSHFTRGKDGAPASNTPPLSADADKGDQDIVVFTGDGVIADPIGASEARTYTHEGTTFRLHNCVGVCATGDKVPALTNPGQGGQADAVNAMAPGPVQFQWASGGGKVENPTMQSLRSNAEYSYQFIRNAMQVRRLTPTECAYLQGFPSDYLDITFRKKPAADGPKYRALGNSMAVPCMWWLGLRIHKATSHD